MMGISVIQSCEAALTYYRKAAEKGLHCLVITVPPGCLVYLATLWITKG